MTAGDITRIEIMLGHHVPHYYREFILANSDELDVLRERGTRGVIHTAPDDIIDDNLHLRRMPESYPIGGEDGEPWPANYFVIGSICGDYFFVHRDAWDVGLWFYRRGDASIRQLHYSLIGYLDRLQADLLAQPNWEHS